MTNEELKKKIVEILEETEYEWTEEKNGYILQIFYDKLADALIAAGIGDVSEWKHRAEVAERALFISAKEIEYLNGNFDSSAEFFAQEKVIPFLMRQAEKELAEEEKE